jgi:hypothetical protein
MTQKPTIFINPKFKNIHVNPNFLQPQKVLLNPKFFVGHDLVVSEPPLPEPIVKPPLPPLPPTSSNVLIRNTRRTLIRSNTLIRAASSSRPNDAVPAVIPPQHTLIKVSKNKLVTAAHLMKCQQKENAIIKSTTESIIRTKKLHREEKEKPASVYSVDRRTPKKKKIASTYSIRRVTPRKT